MEMNKNKLTCSVFAYKPNGSVKNLIYQCEELSRYLSKKKNKKRFNFEFAKISLAMFLIFSHRLSFSSI